MVRRTTQDMNISQNEQQHNGKCCPNISSSVSSLFNPLPSFFYRCICISCYRELWTSHENWVNFLYFHALRLWPINITSSCSTQPVCSPEVSLPISSECDRSPQKITNAPIASTTWTKPSCSTKNQSISQPVLYSTHTTQLNKYRQPQWIGINVLFNLSLSVSLGWHQTPSSSWEYLCLCIVSDVTPLQWGEDGKE